jgi:twitching motility protein PilT
VLLAMVLQTVISQQLVPLNDGGLVPAFEIMHLNNAIRNMIRESKIHQLDAMIASSGAEGMITMDNSLLDLVKQGRISKETAIKFAVNPEQMTKRMSI